MSQSMNNNSSSNPCFGLQSSQFQLSQLSEAHSHAHAIALAQSNARSQADAVPSHGPDNAGAKRVPRRPTGLDTGSRVRMLELTPAARCKKKPKLHGKQLQERVASILPPSALYTQLREFESLIDAALVKKKIDVQEAVKCPPYVQKTLRIYVFNTSANQIRTIPENPNAEPPTWTLKIVGRILEEGMDSDQTGLMLKQNPMYPKFSSFLKRVAISLDQKLYPDDHIIVWDSSTSTAHREGFEVKRKGDEEFIVKIRFEMNSVTEKFMLSSPLMEVLGTEVDSQARIVSALWQYIKYKKLQNVDDPSCFNCDPQLLKVFGEEKVKFSMVSQKISNHLTPLPPILLEHKIKLSGDAPAGNACYDVLVDVPLLVQKDMKAVLAKKARKKEIEACDEAILTTIRKINEHRRRRAFFLGFSESPVKFIDALIESQVRDLQLLAGDANRNAEKESSRADFYSEPWVGDAVIQYLNSRPARIADKST